MNFIQFLHRESPGNLLVRKGGDHENGIVPYFERYKLEKVMEHEKNTGKIEICQSEKVKSGNYRTPPNNVQVLIKDSQINNLKGSPICLFDKYRNTVICLLWPNFFCDLQCA